MRIHELKCDPIPFAAILDGNKCFEFRKNDRDFQYMDILLLREYIFRDESRDRFYLLEYSGREILARVTHIIYGPRYEIPEGYCCMSIRVLE